MIFDVNFLAVLVAAIAGIAIGAFWYSPAGFGKIWMKESGFSEESLDEAKKKGMAKSFILGFVASLVMAYVLAYFVQIGGAGDIAGALQLGFWLWLGFIATIMLNGVLWEGKSWKLYILNIAHQLVSLLVMAIILVLWV